MDRKIKLTFLTSMGSTLSMNIPYARENLTEEDLRAAMSSMLDAGILISVNGNAIRAEKAEVIETVERKIV